MAIQSCRYDSTCTEESRFLLSMNSTDSFLQNTAPIYLHHISILCISTSQTKPDLRDSGKGADLLGSRATIGPNIRPDPARQLHPVIRVVLLRPGHLSSCLCQTRDLSCFPFQTDPVGIQMVLHRALCNKKRHPETMRRIRIQITIPALESQTELEAVPPQRTKGVIIRQKGQGLKERRDAGAGCVDRLLPPPKPQEI